MLSYMTYMTSQGGQVARSQRGQLGPQHPVAAVVERLCRAHSGGGRFIGGVGCGACWEQAIRADERAVVLFGLPRECEPDPTLVDEIAVELACAGEPVWLTAVERAEVVRRLTARGEPAWLIAQRLGTTARGVTRARAVARASADRVLASEGEAA
jgi:hypothetical protein